MEIKTGSGAMTEADPADNSWTAWGAPLLLLLVTFCVFLPCLNADFVYWDDFDCVLQNQNYRGFGWPQLRWMFTTFQSGPYQPLTWLSFALDHSVWGMAPYGYHLTNLLLHCANAALFYFLALRLLRLAGAAADRPDLLRPAALLAALLFAVHPLRVESVAWVTERKDVLSGVFYLATLYAYLEASSGAGSPRRRWYLLALAAYVFSLLAKGIGITLPAALLILDIYPLRRLSGNPLRWKDPGQAGVLLEKVPFVIIAAVFALAGYYGQQKTGAVLALPASEFWARVAQPMYGLAFYLRKTLLPLGLSPLYERPLPFDPFAFKFVASGIASAGVTAGFVLTAKRRPAGLAAWAYYCVTLVPVLGFIPFGLHLAADRYSYLSCLAWPLLGAGAVLHFLRNYGRRGLKIFYPAAAVCAAVVCALSVLTWRQCGIWRDSDVFWEHALKLDPDSAHARYNYGTFLYRNGRKDAALAEYREMLRLLPQDAQANNSVGTVLADHGNFSEALPYLVMAVKLRPEDAKLRHNLASLLAQMGRAKEALDEYSAALRLDPGLTAACVNMAVSLQTLGRTDDAVEYYRRALKTDPRSHLAYNNLAGIMAARGKFREAVTYHMEALRANTNPADGAALRANFAETLFLAGRYEEAAAQFLEAAKLAPGEPAHYRKTGSIFALTGRAEEAALYFRKALALAPGDPEILRALDSLPAGKKPPLRKKVLPPSIDSPPH